MTPSGEGLIVDVGMNDGSDAEFYLAKGFDVVAIEANPALVREASKRLAAPLEDGRLVIHQVAVGDTEGTVDFYVGDEELWGSLTPDMADRGFATERTTFTVPCTTLDKLLAAYPTPHYVKIDVEGADVFCVDALERLAEPPRFVSFEADLTDRAETTRILDQLEAMGYRRFKLINQATHSTRRLPNPPREGRYVDVRFGKHHSGPFGEELPGEWRTRAEVQARYEAVLTQQAARIEYSTRGKLFGIPLGRLHRPMIWTYNLRPVTAARHRWAAWRGVEAGGWFDIHAAH